MCFVHEVCQVAGSASFVDDARFYLRWHGVLAAIKRHDSAPIFDWLVRTASYHGIADRVATQYMEAHGYTRWGDVATAIDDRPQCPKLASYWQFDACRYAKTAHTCARPDLIATCPLPTHPLRNGHLNQTAYSLFLFIRDIAEGDIVAWIDQQLAAADDVDAPARLAHLQARLVEPLRHIYGISDKVVGMALATLLIGAGHLRPAWLEVGGGMIAIDTLVHNFLHRTGILRRYNAGHAYGPGCYLPGRCADIIADVAGAIDARDFNRNFPATFPRFIQHAVWRYCAQLEFNICNGNRIDDRARCGNIYCKLYAICDRIKLAKRPTH